MYTYFSNPLQKKPYNPIVTPMEELKTEIEIKATSSKIWQVLTDFTHYREWNPFIQEIQGDLAEGEKLIVKMTLDGKKTVQFKPKVTYLRTHEEFRWLGKLLIPGLFDGEHGFEIHDLHNGSCRFIHKERFTGLLVPLFTNMLDTKVKANFERMNQALKSRCEST